MEEIVNRVANSALEVFDLEDYFPKAPIVGIDISLWLEEGFLLREKEYRAALKAEDWSKYQDQLVYVYCSTDAIVPTWAYLLVMVNLQPIAHFVQLGTQAELLSTYYEKKLASLDYEPYRAKPVILKGCSRKAVPNSAYISALRYLQNEAKSIMFGEACSAVPLFKAK